MMSNLRNVTMRGAIRRSELVQEQLKAQLLTYPCNYEELFAIAVAEAECAGVLPITTKVGALPTTNEGWLVEPGDFTNAVILALETPMDEITQSVWRQNLLKRFGPERILAEWDKVFAS
jgi:glycosyltransferase involved in cell wall biosynthesis